MSLKYEPSLEQRTDKAGYADSFQFMLRLKNPCGKMTPQAYKALDDCATKYVP